MANELDRPEAPAIPLAPAEYNRPYNDQKDNVFRLFFNRLNSVLSAVLTTDNGGRFIYTPRAAFYSTADQTATSINTGYAVTFNQTTYASGITLSNNSRLNVTHPGTYHFDATLQLEHNNSSATSVTVWVQKNGAAVAYSGHRFNVKGNDDDIIHWGFSADLVGSDYIEIYWATGDTQLNLHTEAASSPHPGLPSASVEIQYVSNS
jgi:hypothetical protein